MLRKNKTKSLYDIAIEKKKEKIEKYDPKILEAK